MCKNVLRYYSDKDVLAARLMKSSIVRMFMRCKVDLNHNVQSQTVWPTIADHEDNSTADISVDDGVHIHNL